MPWLVALWLGVPAGASPLDPPPPAALDEARVIVQEMKDSERGPYLRIRWFCEDGTVQPPTPYACRDRGGGRQHAEYSTSRQRLADLGWSVGTIFSALDWSTLWVDGDERRTRLRELPLERYLIDVDDGWVLRRARHYRGRVQVEDEEVAGRELLLQLMAQGGWLTDHFLATREVVRAVPHRAGEDLMRDIRRTAQDIAERDETFERLRVETHTSPSAATAGRIRAWAAAPGRDPTLAKEATALADGLDRLYGSAGRAERLATARKRLARFAVAAPVVARLRPADGETGLATLQRLTGAMAAARDSITSPTSSPAARLALFDLLGELEPEVIVLAREHVSGQVLARATLLLAAAALDQAAFGAGLLSAGERDAVAAALAGPLHADAVSLAQYTDTTRTLNLAGTWAVGSVRYAFAEALVRYSALAPRSAQFVDDLLRGSVLLPFARVSGRLAADAQRLGGVQRQIFGEATADVLALNPGLARGPLRVLDEAEMSAHALPVKRDEIVVLPAATAELPPVTGVMTVGESNPLSHVQLLARNFGIPNLSITPVVYNRLAAHRGERVLLAVGSDGTVYIGPTDEPAGARPAAPPSPEEKLEVPMPDLSIRQPIPLADLHRGLSGRLVGPKAANLGELNRLFPGRVAPAIALPFGIFDAYTNTGDHSPRARLDGAYEAARAGHLDEAALLAELASIRQAIAAVVIDEPLRSDLAQMMRKVFGPSDDYGLFIRSDTNVEDLPGFTGAGLSLTLPHVVGMGAQLASIPQVWASVLSPRAIAWRANLLKNPERVYSSVLLMKSVPSDKSGVLVTADVANRGPGLTVSTAWGVGGAVGGETTETLLLADDAGERLLSEAKAPYRRTLDPGGGIRWRAARDGAVLTAPEKAQLRALAREVDRRAVAATGPQGQKLPWDIEFGFVDGELTLFQIRPLIERGEARADRLLATLLPEAPNPALRVDLSVPPAGRHDGQP